MSIFAAVAAAAGPLLSPCLTKLSISTWSSTLRSISRTKAWIKTKSVYSHHRTIVSQTCPQFLRASPFSRFPEPVPHSQSSGDVGDSSYCQEKKQQQQRQKSWHRVRLWVLLGFGFAVGFLGLKKSSAMALGPEGPLVEEFRENVTRYLVYFLTVSTGALYAVVKPIVELLRSPISAILVLIIIGGTFYLVYLTLSAMFGLTDFSNQYAS